MALWITTAISAVGGAISSYLSYRRAVSDANREARIAQIKAGEAGWKDEWITIVWSFPFVTAFVPWFGIRDNTIAAFQFVTSLPPWYVWGWVSISLAVVGAGKLIEFKVRK